jgi:prepilin-type N-terminal cleavage/methylation domain-containing protein
LEGGKTGLILPPNAFAVVEGPILLRQVEPLIKKFMFLRSVRVNIPGKKSIPAFTLIELMVVVFIVGILAAIVIPIYRSRVDKAKWSEGKAMMGTIATAVRAWSAEKSADYAGPFSDSLVELGFSPGDCTGSYFSDEDFTVLVTGVNPPLFVVTCSPATQSDRPSIPSSVTLTANADGTMTWSQVD